MNVRIDEELCLGAAACVRHAPAAFRMNEDDIAEVVDPGEETLEALRRAAEACPAGAIYVDEDASA